MINKIGTAAMLSQIAKSSCDLANAALRLESIIRGENPQGTNVEKAKEELKRSYNMVLLCSAQLGLKRDKFIQDKQLQHWKERLHVDEE